MRFSSRLDVAASTVTDSLVREPLKKEAKVEPKDLLMELQLLHAAACAAVSGLSARRDKFSKTVTSVALSLMMSMIKKKAIRLTRLFLPMRVGTRN